MPAFTVARRPSSAVRSALSGLLLAIVLTGALLVAAGTGLRLLVSGARTLAARGSAAGR